MIPILPIAWVRLERYCDAVGLPPATANNLIREGRWLEGKHWKLGPDRRRWVHIEQAQEWVERGHLKSA